ncbi:hypothetical protein [Nonomuraea typhae]|uniref:Uncharacterized protein n=1 Tax=Nonomuraea typhae TaxID=2603600 RepID=A0ABW7Z2C9_9ACTN
MAIALQRGRLRARLAPRLVLPVTAFCIVAGAYGSAAYLAPEDLPRDLAGPVMAAAGYAVVVALVPYGQAALLSWCVAGALGLGYLWWRWPPVPWERELPEAWRVVRSGVDWAVAQPVTLLLVLSVVVLALAWASISRIRTVRTARPTRSVSLFHPLEPWRRALGGALALLVFLVALQAAAVVRMTVFQVADAPVRAAELRMAYLPHLLVAAFLVAGSPTGGTRPLFHLVVTAAVARGLWPYPLPGELKLPGLLPAAFWTVLAVHVPAAVLGTYLVQRLLRWPYPRMART